MGNILVTGTNSGLGKYLLNDLNKEVISLTRSNRFELIKKLKSEGVDMIIHPAFGFQGGYEQHEIKDYFKYIDDNILLTKELTEIPHKKFIYISSLAVYDPNPINYKFTKLYAESIVSELGSNPLILRCSSMLGVDIKPNNVTRLIDNPNHQLSLAPNSEFNYILHSDIKNCILKSYKENINGIIDFVASDNIKLKEISKILKIKANYGNYEFISPRVANSKLLQHFPELNKTSKETFKQFLKI